MLSNPSWMSTNCNGVWSMYEYDFTALTRSAMRLVLCSISLRRFFSEILASNQPRESSNASLGSAAASFPSHSSSNPTLTNAEASFQPSVTVPVDLDGARKVLKLIDALEDSDDVQDVYTNIDIPDDVAAILDEE